MDKDVEEILQIDENTQSMENAVHKFLHSPTYSLPLLNFIDENCSMFDSSEENKPEYHIAHENFKQLVDGLICDFVTHLGVPIHQFVGMLTRQLQLDFYSIVVTSILTVEDFILFKEMMVKRNAQLLNQVLALEQLERLHSDKSKYTIDNAIATIHALQNPRLHARELDEVLHLSKEEYLVEKNLHMELSEAQKSEFDKAIYLSLLTFEEQNKVKDAEKAQLQTAIDLSIVSNEERKKSGQEVSGSTSSLQQGQSTITAPRASKSCCMNGIRCRKNSTNCVADGCALEYCSCDLNEGQCLLEKMTTSLDKLEPIIPLTTYRNIEVRPASLADISSELSPDEPQLKSNKKLLTIVIDPDVEESSTPPRMGCKATVNKFNTDYCAEQVELEEIDKKAEELEKEPDNIIEAPEQLTRGKIKDCGREEPGLCGNGEFCCRRENIEFIEEAHDITTIEANAASTTIEYPWLTQDIESQENSLRVIIRRQYLKKQRDRIIAQKRAMREKKVAGQEGDKDNLRLTASLHRTKLFTKPCPEDIEANRKREALRKELARSLKEELANKQLSSSMDLLSLA